MPTRMLIDARHREETRVAVVQKNRIEEFDFESEEHKQLKGNIYLAKVTRVEPSLQAAFIDYGGNRHGFLAFSEIHPDYYQIPKSDRDQLLAEEAEHAKEEAKIRASEDDAAASNSSGDEDAEIEETGDADADDEHHDEPSVQNIRKKRMDLRRRYKIQDVIHRRQVLLVQVVKEERGNKGAALTTYLSLAGRYCVLMPNTSHGGGISRKISNASDRKRLKSIVDELKLPDTMGCIVRTAGMSRTKAEIKRDFTYLARLWDEIREATLKATAPEKIYTDSDLIKRAIRDIYNREIEEVVIEGEHGYKAAKDFMKLLMPSHARRVKPYADAVPLFQRFQVEDQLSAMYQPLVQLKSGGYLVINPTEALVSIDINSGRSTREHNIEQTALKTNIEAAHEIARQLRLRDMAGLVVIDFIDMDHHSNNRKVEKALKDSLKNDRARIQVGRISSFGLLEMSRQRLRTGVLEASTFSCPHCEGTGLMRTASSAGLSALRLIEEEAASGKGSELSLGCSRDAAVYLLNSKRRELIEIEERYGVSIAVQPDRNLEGAAMEMEVSGPAPEKPVEMTPLAFEEEDEPEEEEFEEDEAEDEDETEDRSDGPSRTSSRRRRGRRGGRSRKPSEEGGGEQADDAKETAEDDPQADAGTDDQDKAEQPPKKRSRRGRRGGRRSRKPDSNSGEQGETQESGESDADAAEAPEAEAERESEAKSEPEAKKPRSRTSRARKPAKSDEPEMSTASEPADPEPEAEKPEAAKPKRSRARPAKPEQAANDDNGSDAKNTSAEAAAAEEQGPPRRGWWQRTFGE